MATDYPSDWDRRRRDVYERDRYTCQNCGRQGGPYGDAELHAHHIVPKSTGGTHKKSNLKTVCRDCHQAIHGNSVAPSAASEQAPEQDVSVSLAVDKFPYAAAEFVEFGRGLEETTDRFETTADALDDLLDLLDMHVSLDSGERPPRFHDQYERRYREATEAIQGLEDHLDKLTREQPKFSESTSTEEYKRFTQHASTSVALLEECLTLVAEMIESDEISESEFAEFKLLDAELNESVDALVDAMEDLMMTTSDEIERIVDNIRQNIITYTGINPYDDCPICGAAEVQMQTSDDLELVRCTECRTEFQSDSSFTWKVIHSSKPIEGISLSTEMWKAFNLDDPDDTDYIEELERVSEKHVKGAKGLLVAASAIQILGVISGLNSGNFMIIVLAVLVSFAVVGLGIKGIEAAVHP